MPERSNAGQITPASTASSLLERAKARDADAWKKLVAIYGPVVYRWARLCNLQANDAADISQEVFQSVANKLTDFRRDRPDDSFRGWLWTITRNKVHDHYRRYAARPDAAGGSSAQQCLAQIPARPPDESAKSYGNPMDFVAQRACQLMQSEFEETTWRAFWRVAVDGRPAAEVADELGMTKGAVRQAKYRVLQRLRQELAELS